jgi:hypothetical protein
MSIPPFCFVSTNVCCLNITVVSPYLVVYEMRHLSLRLICIIAGIHSQSLLHETNLADPYGPSWLKFAAQDKVRQQWAEFETLCVQSLLPLHRTKSSNEGQILETHSGQSPLLCKAKSSNKGQIL